MIEVPSAVYLAGALASQIDFLSVGSNDLTQYLLAVDRNNPRVADLYRALHPAVLAALQHVVDAAHSHGKTVSICGELAGDPRAVPLLLAMGFDQLSMNAANLPRVKKILTSMSLKDTKVLLKSTSTLWTADEVGAKVDELLHTLSLQRYIRGKGDTAIDTDGARSTS